MRRFLFLVLASSLVYVAQAQRVYFMYLQSENAAPFFVKMADHVYSSTATGYVILSNLKDSTYTFSVGFPGGKASETRFGVTIDKNDRGFLLKNFEDGLALFDLQSLGVIKSMAMAGVPDNGQVVARTGAFTKQLSEAADDESLLYATVAVKKEEPKKEVKKEREPEVKSDVIAEKKIEPKTDVVAVVDAPKPKTEAEKPATEPVKATESPAKEAPKTDTLVAIAPVKEPEVKTEPVKEADVKKEAVVSQPEEPTRPTGEEKAEGEKPAPVSNYKRSLVTRRSESSTTEGFGLVFLDDQDGAVDTIRLLIPNPKKPFVEEAVVKEAEKPKAEEPAKAAEVIKTDEVKAEASPKTEKTRAEETETVVQSNKKENRRKLKDLASDFMKGPGGPAPTPAPKVENSSCKALATERDFLRVRKNMASETNDEAMIDKARVFFRAKCFTTEQIKNLSSLFLTSAAKYEFFDAAYPHVTDPSQFPSLQSEIKDSYYLKRFKALIGE